MSIRDFLRHHYRHFNAATLVDAAEGYCDHLATDGRMMVTLAGAMSTAERFNPLHHCTQGATSLLARLAAPTRPPPDRTNE